MYGTRDFDRVIPIFVNQALRGLPLTLYGGKQILDFVWIDTVVESLVRVGWGDVPSGPMNIGSGKPTDLITLAKRVLLAANSRSDLRIAPAREIEVSRFVADTSFMRHTFAMEATDDPLDQLATVIEYAETGLHRETCRPIGVTVRCDNRAGYLASKLRALVSYTTLYAIRVVLVLRVQQLR